MKTFALVLALYASDGTDENHAIKTNLSFENCMAAVELANENGEMANFSELICEAEFGA